MVCNALYYQVISYNKIIFNCKNDVYYRQLGNITKTLLLRIIFTSSLFFVGIFSFNLPSFASNHNQDGYTEYLFQQGLASLVFGDYEEAISTFEQILKRDPNHIDAMNNIAIAFSELGKNEEAISYYDQILEIDPNNSLTWNNKGYLISQSGKYEEAISYYDKALEINPDYIDALYNKAFALEELSLFEDATFEYERILKSDPKEIDVLYFKARALGRAGHPEKALLDLNILLERNPSFFYQIKNNTITLLIEKEAQVPFELEKTLQRYPHVLKAFEKNALELIIKEKEVDKTKILTTPKIPDWIRNNAKWWAEGGISDKDFVSGIQYLIKQKIMQIPDTVVSDSTETENKSVTDQGYIQVNGKEFFGSSYNPIVVTITGEVEEDQAPIECDFTKPGEYYDEDVRIIVKSDQTFQHEMRFGYFEPGEYTLDCKYKEKDLGSVSFTLAKSSDDKPVEKDSTPEINVPGWIKNNADWWSQGLISDDDFVKGIQYLVEQGIIKV